MPRDNDLVPYHRDNSSPKRQRHSPQSEGDFVEGEYRELGEIEEGESRYYFIHQIVTLQPQDQYGALVVYSSRRGWSISLYPDFRGLAKNVYHANTVGRRVNGEEIIAAVFPRLEPGNYKVVGAGYNMETQVTIFPGEIAEIDDRR
jgi:hypothetical protein